MHRGYSKCFSSDLVAHCPSKNFVNHSETRLRLLLLFLVCPYSTLCISHSFPLGTPIETYDKEGLCARELGIYGRIGSVLRGRLHAFLHQGQYLDTETGLAYNRFRYYSPETGAYISQDPIRLEAGLTNVIHGHPITEAEYKKLTKVH